MTKKSTLIRLLTIHQSILHPTWMQDIIHDHHIQPIDLHILRKQRQSSSPLETHHMIYRELGGSSKQRNEVSLPRHIHRRIHREFPDTLPHDMILQTTTTKPHQNITDYYVRSVWPDLGIQTHHTNQIVQKFLQNQKRTIQ